LACTQIGKWGKEFSCVASFYRRFVKDFSTIVTPLNEVVKKLIGFKWGEEQELAFVLLKEKLCFAPIFYANLVITWSRNPHTKIPIPGKPSKSGLIGVWHKDNLYLGTSTIRNGDPLPMNIDSRTRSIRMTPRKQLFFDKSFFSSLENHGREIISPTHTQSAAKKKFY